VTALFVGLFPNVMPSNINEAYNLTVTNIGASAALNTTVTDQLPAGVPQASLTFVSCTTTVAPFNCSSGFTFSGPSGTVTWNIGTLAAGGSAVVTINLTINAIPGPALSSSFTLTNTATVSTSTAEPATANNTSTTTTTVNP